MEKENMFMNCSFFKPNWDDQTDPFESALSSMVSSPTASNCNNNGENIVLRELIGRLGSICNSGEIYGGNSANTSKYSTPQNSPPKLNLSTMENQQIRGTNLQIPPPFSTDPGFAERAARFSCFANKPHLGGSQLTATVQENWEGENGDSRENSSVSEQIPFVEIGIIAQNDSNSRKRKSNPKGKGKEKETSAAAAANPAKDVNNNVASENSESSAKRSKSEDDNQNITNQKQSKDNNSKAAEPPKDYIHVRARRGQATDAHSLAERVRREKISERMKVLQDLVPGCNKVTGKAVMLDEIINYVQSLQRQVEFLSMKLATVNPRMEFNMETLMSKDMFTSRGSLPHSVYQSDSYPFQSQSNMQNAIGTDAPFAANNLSNAAISRNQLPPMDNFSETASQVSSFWEDDLHSIVQMGFGQNQTQNFQGILSTNQMKVEL